MSTAEWSDAQSKSTAPVRSEPMIAAPGPSVSAATAPSAPQQVTASGAPPAQAAEQEAPLTLIRDWDGSGRPGADSAGGGAPLRAALTPELERLRARAQERLLGSEPQLATLELRADSAGTRSGMRASRREPPFVVIENEPALATFHAALARLRAGTDPDGKVRILAYGASHTQADLYTGYLRTYLQSRFGDGGQGFVLLGRVNHWYRTLDTTTRHYDLSVLHARYREQVSSEPLGLFGAALSGKHPGAYAELYTSKDATSTRFELQFLMQPRGGDFRVYVDDTLLGTVATEAVAERPGYYAFETTRGAHHIRVTLAGNGPVRWFGVVAESATPGVVLDTLGISGSRIIDQLRWREDFWTEAVRRRAPDLIMFAYGTNETMDTGLTLERYEAELREVLARVRRALPETSCVLITPFDLPSKARARLVRIVDTQRRVSQDFGCGLWDGYAFMGGEGSIRRWNRAKPPLAAPDHIHLTRRGYVYAGLALGDALMRAYDADANQSGGGEACFTASSQSP